MAGLSDLLGKGGAIEQIMLWQTLGQVIGTLSAPGLTALLQDVQAKHPELALDPVTAATAEARDLIGEGKAAAEAAAGGLSAERFAVLRALHKVRLSPAELAELVLRSYLELGEAEAEARPQGISAEQLKLLVGLAGDAPGPDQLAEALRRRIIEPDGSGLDSTSFAQGIRETRLHDKWAPVIRELARQLLSAPDAASAVVRRFLDHDQGEAAAALQGVDAAVFATMVHLAGDAPGPQQLAEALRRGAIPAQGTGPDSTSFEQGIAEGRLADKWAPVIEALAKLWPTPVDALEASLKGQLTADQGRAMYELLGGDPQFYDWLLASQGDAPSPLEAASMAARGIIPWLGDGPDSVSFYQAVREGRTRNKWSDALRAMSKYLPAPGEIITFLAHNAIDAKRATELLADHDMPPDILAAYLAEAELTNLSDYRGLTQGAVVDMYYAHLIGRDQATELLGLLHVTAKAADLLLSYADLRQVIDSIQRSVQRIAGLYTGRKIGRATALKALLQLEIPVESAEQIMSTWDLQAQANVKTLTEAQIVGAWYLGIIDLPTAIAELAAIGYTPYDAWVLLSLKAKAPLPNPPARDVAAPAGAVIPGVT